MTDHSTERVRKFRERRAEEHSKNKNAFDDVIGDPFALEPVEGAYLRYKRQTQVKIQHIDDLGHGSTNPARPLINDFFVDVENIIEEVLDQGMFDLFWDAYLYEDPQALDPRVRNSLEQRLGKLFWVRGISPVNKYFIAVRRNSKRG